MDGARRDSLGKMADFHDDQDMLHTHADQMW